MSTLARSAASDSSYVAQLRFDSELTYYCIYTAKSIQVLVGMYMQLIVPSGRYQIHVLLARQKMKVDRLLTYQVSKYKEK